MRMEASIKSLYFRESEEEENIIHSLTHSFFGKCVGTVGNVLILQSDCRTATKHQNDAN